MNKDARETAKLNSGWLSHVTPDLADTLIMKCRTRTFSEGDTIYTVGQDQQSLFGIRSGKVRMFVSVNDHPLHFAHVAGPGFWFGEFEFIIPRSRVMEMVAAEPSTILEIKREAFDKIAARDMRAWHAVATLAGLNQAITLGAGDDLLVKDSMQRLVSVLLRLAGYRNGFQGNPPMDQVPVTQRELADASCLSLSKAAALLSELSDKGGIMTDYRSIRILNVSLLRELLV